MKTQLTVFFDGKCPLCSREINHYKKKDEQSQLIEFIDISSEGFQADAFGLEEGVIHKKMHVKRVDGTIVTGVDAFIAIWNLFDDYKWLVQLVGSTFIKPLAKMGYWCFARLRPYLPGRKIDCENDQCQL